MLSRRSILKALASLPLFGSISKIAEASSNSVLKIADEPVISISSEKLEIIEYTLPIGEIAIMERKGMKCAVMSRRYEDADIVDAALFVIVPSFELAAYPEWRISQPEMREDGRKRGLESVMKQQDSCIAKLKADFEKHYGCSPSKCLVPHRCPLTFLPIDGNNAGYTGEVIFKEIGLIMLG
jgi:hypothetical protein